MKQTYEEWLQQYQGEDKGLSQIVLEAWHARDVELAEKERRIAELEGKLDERNKTLPIVSGVEDSPLRSENAKNVLGTCVPTKEEMKYAHRKAIRDGVACHSNPLSQAECQALINTIDALEARIEAVRNMAEKLRPSAGRIATSILAALGEPVSKP